jgi:hypothetical protein
VELEEFVHAVKDVIVQLIKTEDPEVQEVQEEPEEPEEPDLKLEVLEDPVQEIENVPDADRAEVGHYPLHGRDDSPK